jgi:hypothetical protein
VISGIDDWIIIHCANFEQSNKWKLSDGARLMKNTAFASACGAISLPKDISKIAHLRSRLYFLQQFLVILCFMFISAFLLGSKACVMPSVSQPGEPHNTVSSFAMIQRWSYN